MQPSDTFRIQSNSVDVAWLRFNSPDQTRTCQILGTMHTARADFYRLLNQRICNDPKAICLAEGFELAADAPESQLNELKFLDSLNAYKLQLYTICGIDIVVQATALVLPQDRTERLDVTVSTLPPCSTLEPGVTIPNSLEAQTTFLSAFSAYFSMLKTQTDLETRIAPHTRAQFKRLTVELFNSYIACDDAEPVNPFNTAREAALVKRVNEDTHNSFIIPWGAAHTHAIANALLSQNWEQESLEFVPVHIFE